MVHFSKKLSISKFPDWDNEYLEYKILKKKLKSLKSIIKISNEIEKENEIENFKKYLDAQIEKIVLFYLEKQGEFSKDLVLLRNELEVFDQNELNNDIEKIQNLAQKYRLIADDLIRLIRYVELNATGLRKILKKYDKNIKDNKLFGDYLLSRVDRENSHLQQLYHYEGISAITASIRSGLSKLRLLEYNYKYNNNNNNTLELKKNMIKRTLSQTEPVLNKIDAARKRLRKSTKYVKVIAAQALIFESEESSDEEDLNHIDNNNNILKSYDVITRPNKLINENQLDVNYETFYNIQNENNKIIKKNNISRILNFASTFLYMMNYYIVAPTSGQYGLALGGNPSLSGTIIGMTPLAALVSAILYSYWANKSYKNPLIFASFCLIIGNLLYALALPFDNFFFIMIGRLLNGFGGARAINRRYIADTYSKEERTSASAMFVTAGALGMAAGPAIASIIFNIPDRYVFGLLITVETAPGWLMFLIWSLFLILILFFFKEPIRLTNNHSPPKKIQKELESNVHFSNENLSLIDSHMIIKNKTTLSLWKNIPVMTCLWIYFILKLILECLLTSESFIVTYYFSWKFQSAGIYLAMMGLLMFPANILVGYLSYKYDDRELIIGSQSMIFIGMIGIISYGTYTIYQYIFGSIIVFIFTNVLEGVTMALLSKTIPKKYAKGTFNSGLLATEAGTFGRALGANLITFVGYMGMDHLVSFIFIPLTFISTITIFITYKLYHFLQIND